MIQADKLASSKVGKIARFVGNLETAHTSTVNCLKFSPTGQYFASGGDDNKVILWEQKWRFTKFGSDKQEFGWSPSKSLLGHSAEVYDLCWGHTQSLLFSASIDMTVIIWNIQRGKCQQRLEAHTYFVQGLAIDPFEKLLVTMSADRTTRVWKRSPRKKMKSMEQFYQLSVIKKMELKGVEDNNNNNNFEKNEKQGEQQQQQQQQQQQIIQEEPIEQIQLTPETPTLQPVQKNISGSQFKLFLDETIHPSFVRRPAWSPDGSFCLLPASQFKLNKDEKDNSNQLQLGVLIFRRCNMSTPVLFLQTQNKPAIVCKFCPQLFKRDNKFSIFDIGYKMYFAIGTSDSVLLYSTESLTPLATMGNIHYAPVNDIAWFGSQMLACCSSDGYCSFLAFQDNELGEEYPFDQLNEKLQEALKVEQFQKQQEKQIEILSPIQKQQVEYVRSAGGQERKKIIPVMLNPLK